MEPPRETSVHSRRVWSAAGASARPQPTPYPALAASLETGLGGNGLRRGCLQCYVSRSSEPAAPPPSGRTGQHCGSRHLTPPPGPDLQETQPQSAWPLPGGPPDSAEEEVSSAQQGGPLAHPVGAKPRQEGREAAQLAPHPSGPHTPRPLPTPQPCHGLLGAAGLGQRSQSECNCLNLSPLQSIYGQQGRLPAPEMMMFELTNSS